jgi:pimeloyl-ACP methyl ester carboxylesterase
MSRRSPIFFFLLLILIFSLFTPLACGQKIGQEEHRSPGKLPLYSQTLLIDGIKIHFVEAGEGRPLLFLHGLGGSWEDWAANLQSFAPSYRAMAIDFPGFGDSDKPQVDYCIEWLTGMVEKFLEERKLDRVSIVGHSMGALVALNAAVKVNSRVQKLIVADVVGMEDKAEFLSYALTKKIMGPDSRWEPIEGVMRDQFKVMIEMFIKVQRPKTSKEFFQSAPKSPVTGNPLLPMTPAVQMCASILDFDIRPKLAFIPQPTLILWGEKDPVAPPRGAVYLKGKLPHATLTILEGCGHSPMQEQPARFDREVWKFLRAEE